MFVQLVGILKDSLVGILKDSLLFEFCYLGFTALFPKRCPTSPHSFEHILCKTGFDIMVDGICGSH